MLTAGRHIAAEISFITAESIAGYATGGDGGNLPGRCRASGSYFLSGCPIKAEYGIGVFKYKNLLDLSRRKLPMVSQKLHDFGLLSQSLSPLSSFACKAKLARFCDPAVNISCGTGSYKNNIFGYKLLINKV